MSLKDIADYVRSHGRDEDTMLIHMTPREIQGLQTLAKRHGGSLTINPDTGLPEAGFLKNILPVIAGAALAPFTGGLSAALIAGAGSGLYEGIKSGDPGKGMLAALTGGLGAYGGAGLARGLSTLGARAAAPGLTQAATPSMATAVPNTAFPTGASFTGGAGTAGQAAVNTTAQQALQPVTFSNMGRGAQMAVQNPGSYVDAMGGGMNTAKYGLAALTPAMLNPPDRRIPGSREPSSLAGLSDDFYQRPMFSGAPLSPRGFNAGGPIGNYSDGGHLTMGAGDGMSDQIPASINGEEPARMSSEEFVIPADVVSGLGNGSSRAGAERLYAMLDRVRQGRTGTPQQAPAINAMGMMPA